LSRNHDYFLHFDPLTFLFKWHDAQQAICCVGAWIYWLSCSITSCHSLMQLDDCFTEWLPQLFMQTESHTICITFWGSHRSMIACGLWSLYCKNFTITMKNQAIINLCHFRLGCYWESIGLTWLAWGPNLENHREISCRCIFSWLVLYWSKGWWLLASWGRCGDV
jgi:hypothetical protein